MSSALLCLLWLWLVLKTWKTKGMPYMSPKSKPGSEASSRCNIIILPNTFWTCFSNLKWSVITGQPLFPYLMQHDWHCDTSLINLKRRNVHNHSLKDIRRGWHSQTWLNSLVSASTDFTIQVHSHSLVDVVNWDLVFCCQYLLLLSLDILLNTTQWCKTK